MVLIGNLYLEHYVLRCRGYSVHSFMRVGLRSTRESREGQQHTLVAKPIIFEL
jgi:hypothetical protein